MDSVAAGGAEIPSLGLGTWPMTGDACEDAVASALELGYRHVDTAQMYDNEVAVGRAVAASGVPREEVFVVTKLLREHLGHDDVVATTGRSLERLGMETVDLLLVHAPSATVPIEETMAAMNELQREGRVRHVGVSNFSVDQLEAAMDASETPIVTNQVSYHPYRDRTELLAFCIDHDVALTAHTPLDEGGVLGDETLAAIGDRYGKSAAQVALRWLLQQPNVVAIPKAASREHQAANLDVFDFALDGGEMERIFDLGGGLGRRLRDALGL